MAGPPVDIRYKFSTTGTDEVKSELDQLADAFHRAKAAGGSFSKEQRALTPVMNGVINQTRLENRLFLAQHPNLLKISRVISTVTSLSRSLLTIMNAINISKIRSQQVDAAGLLAEREINAIRREQNEELAKLNPSIEKLADIQERLNVALAIEVERIQAIKDAEFDEFFTQISTSIFTFSMAYAAFSKHIKSIVGFFAGIGGAAGLAGGAIALLTSGVAAFFAIPALVTALPLFVSQFLSLIPGMKELRISFGEFMKSLGTLDGTWLDVAIPKFFNEDIPLAIGNAGIALSQFFLTDLPLWSGIGLELLKTAFITTFNGIISAINFGVNSVISGINLIINGAISAINSFISAINRILTRARLGTIPLIPSFSGIPTVNLPLIAAAKGFNGMVNSPTMFLAGEAGPEQVSITPNGGGRSGGGNTLIINVGGSVVTERKLAQIVDQYQKQNLKSRGFTGFG